MTGRLPNGLQVWLDGIELTLLLREFVGHRVELAGLGLRLLTLLVVVHRKFLQGLGKNNVFEITGFYSSNLQYITIWNIFPTQLEWTKLELFF